MWRHRLDMGLVFAIPNLKALGLAVDGDLAADRDSPLKRRVDNFFDPLNFSALYAVAAIAAQRLVLFDLCGRVGGRAGDFLCDLKTSRRSLS